MPGVDIASGATTSTATPRKEDPDNKPPKNSRRRPAIEIGRVLQQYPPNNGHHQTDPVRVVPALRTGGTIFCNAMQPASSRQNGKTGLTNSQNLYKAFATRAPAQAAPFDETEGHRPMMVDWDLTDVFSWKEERTVSNSLTLQYDKMLFLLVPKDVTRPSPASASRFTITRTDALPSATKVATCPIGFSTSYKRSIKRQWLIISGWARFWPMSPNGRKNMMRSGRKSRRVGAVKASGNFSRRFGDFVDRGQSHLRYVGLRGG